MENKKIQDGIIQDIATRDDFLLDPCHATFCRDAVRARDERRLEKDIRNPYAHDADRIIHSRAYARYMDKTQVFFQIKNDHLTHRALHVQMVSKIARTLGRFLHLNEDLIEAIALGHDIGHTPFGHAGEKKISEILEKKTDNKESFFHNAQSVRVLRTIEKGGEGLNLTLQVLDGILGHNGELNNQTMEPKREKLSWEKLDQNLTRCFSNPFATKPDKKVFPSTLEGCVVRVSDVIAYIGRDIEDAILLNLIQREDIPSSVCKLLGNTNKTIIHKLCLDILENSYEKGAICFSEPVFKVYQELIKFNYDKIYKHPFVMEQIDQFEKMMELLFDLYLEDLKCGCEERAIFKDFLCEMPDSYINTYSCERIVADYISGMTDEYFNYQFKSRFIPQRINYDEQERLNRLLPCSQNK